MIKSEPIHFRIFFSSLFDWSTPRGCSMSEDGYYKYVLSNFNWYGFDTWRSFGLFVSHNWKSRPEFQKETTHVKLHSQLKKWLSENLLHRLGAKQLHCLSKRREGSGFMQIKCGRHSHFKIICTDHTIAWEFAPTWWVPPLAEKGVRLMGDAHLQGPGGSRQFAFMTRDFPVSAFEPDNVIGNLTPLLYALCSVGFAFFLGNGPRQWMRLSLPSVILSRSQLPRAEPEKGCVKTIYPPP